MAEEKFLIYNARNELFWSTVKGWTEFEKATRFSKVEKRFYELPEHGHWVREEDCLFQLGGQDA